MASIIKSYNAIAGDMTPKIAGKPVGDYDRDLSARQAMEEAEAVLESARAEAEGILAGAREEAGKIRREAEEYAETLRRDAVGEAEEAKNCASKEGYEEGIQRAEQETAELLERGQHDIDALLSEAAEEKRRMFEGAEPQIFELSLEIAEKILGIELEREEAFLSLVRTALASVKLESTAKIRVNPAEYAMYFKSREVTMHTKNGSVSCAVANDPTVGRFGCLIETESGIVDAGLSAQLDQIAGAFGVEKD